MTLATTDRFDVLFAALSDPTRRAIVRRLADGEATVLELAEPFPISLPAVSRHLKVLEQAGLISRSRDGQRRPCRLRPEPFVEIAAWAEHTRGRVGAAPRPPRYPPSAHTNPKHIPTHTGEAMSTIPTTSDATTWALDREIVLVRVLDAPREAVFAAWTDADAFCQWFGPDGFTCTVREMDVRNGGRARFDMTSGDGTVFTNRFDYVDIVPSEKLVMDHGSDIDDDPARFRVTVSFDEQADGKTVLTLRQLHPTVEQRDAGIGFGAVELGLQTMQKLARHLESPDPRQAHGKRHCRRRGRLTTSNTGAAAEPLPNARSNKTVARLGSRLRCVRARLTCPGSRVVRGRDDDVRESAAVYQCSGVAIDALHLAGRRPTGRQGRLHRRGDGPDDDVWPIRGGGAPSSGWLARGWAGEGRGGRVDGAELSRVRRHLSCGRLGWWCGHHGEPDVHTGRGPPPTRRLGRDASW